MHVNKKRKKKGEGISIEMRNRDDYNEDHVCSSVWSRSSNCGDSSWIFFFFSFFATRPVSTSLIEVVFFLNEFSTKIKLQLKSGRKNWKGIEGNCELTKTKRYIRVYKKNKKKEIV